jgi:hypothetical protein
VDDVLEYANLAGFPATGATGKIYVALDNNKIYRWSGTTYIEVSPTVGTIWGGITGTLSNQTDLQNVLNARVPYTGATGAVDLGAYDLTVNELTIGKGGSGLSNNTALGKRALFHITTGNYNTGVGHEALHNTSTGAYNTALGQSAMFTNTTGGQNTAIGINALLYNTSGASNVVVGLDAMHHNTTGSSNIALGYNAGSHITGGVTQNTTSGTSIYIGRDTRANANGGANEIVIGNATTGNGSNTVTIGNSAITANYFTGSINGGSFIKSGGTSSQFLKADGSVDSTTYQTALTNPITGTGTTNTIPKFTSASAIGNSNITDSGTLITLGSNTTISSGGLGIGTTSLGGGNGNLAVLKTITGSNNSFSILQNGIVQSDVTSAAVGIVNLSNTVAASFTLGSYYHISLAQGTFGSGSVVTNQFAYYADSTLIGGTNNFGFYGNIPSGTTRWNLYMNGTAKNYLNGSLLIGSTTDTGQKLQVTGSSLFTGSTTAASAIARGINLTPTLVASANSDVLVGLDIAPTFTNGAFTGVTNYGLRLTGRYFQDSGSSVPVVVKTSNGDVAQYFSTNDFAGFRIIAPISTGVPYIGLNTSGSISTNDIGTQKSFFAYWGDTANYTSFGYGQAVTHVISYSNATGNVNIGINKTTDTGFRLDVTGTTRITGTTASDSPPLGSELLTSSNWTSTDWTGDYTTGFSHTTGNTSVLSNTLAAVIGTYYKIQFTVTNRTAGSFTVSFGGESRSLNSTRTHEPLATTTGNLTITPTSDFNGTIIVSVKTIGLASPTIIINPTNNTTPLGIRATSTSNNTIIGYQAGQRLSNSGAGNDGATNTFIGANAGRNSTTVRSCLFIGVSAGESNVTATDNLAIGNSALFANKLGAENTAVGHSALQNNLSSANCAFGLLSLQLNTTGNLNVAIGNNSSQNNTTGFGNSVLGAQALRFNTTGSNNIAIGTNAGRNIASGNNTIVDTSIFIGVETKALADNQNNQIVIGHGSTGLGSNTTVLGNSSTVTTAIYGDLLLGGTTPITSALLAMTSTTEGFLPPRMTTTQKNAISSPATGLVVFDTTLGKLCVFSTTWQTLTSM